MALAKDAQHFNFYVCIAIALFSVALVFDLLRIPQLKKYIGAFFFGYIFRLVLLFYDVYSSDPLHLPLVGGELASDPLGFYNSAVMFSNGYTISYGGFFSKLMGAIFYLTGDSRLWGEFIVLLFSIGTLVVFAVILNEIDTTQKNKKISMYVVSLLPNYAMLSVIFRRETIITLFLALSLLQFIRWFNDKKGEQAFILSLVFALIASMFHGASGMIVVSYIVVRMLYNKKTKSFSFNGKNVLAAVFFTVVIAFIFNRYISIFFNKFETISTIEDIASGTGRGGSSYAQYVGDSSNPIRMLMFTIPRIMYFMFSPFPWQWRGFNDILTFLMSSVFYLFVILIAIRYLKKQNDGNNKNLVIALLIIALCTTFVFSWGVTNTGTATRHRDKFIILYGVLLSITYKTGKKRANAYRYRRNT